MIRTDRHDGYYFYIHIPFCDRKCSFCFYHSSVSRGGDQVDGYLRDLEREIVLRVGNGNRIQADVVYVGGGTPNTLTKAQLERLFGIISRSVDLAMVREFTMEMNPSSCTEHQLALLKKHGVTRLSFGIQTVDQDILEDINRHHTADPSGILLKARELGFVTNLDFIFGLPHQGVSDADGMIRLIGAVQPDLVTFHELRVGTKAMEEAQRRGSLTHDATQSFYRRFTEGLKDYGYAQFAPELFGRRDVMPLCNYWNDWWPCGKILGFGVSAFSQIEGSFTTNIRSLDGYHDALERGTPPLGSRYPFSPTEQAILNFVSMVSAGFAVDAKEIRRRYGVNIVDVLGEELTESLHDATMILEDGLLFLNPGRFTYSTPSIAFFLRRFGYLASIWDVASGAPDAYRFTVSGDTPTVESKRKRA
ncbi:MAG: radical SAM protein [Candidatus Moraniibacteriota bacterium]